MDAAAGAAMETGAAVAGDAATAGDAAMTVVPTGASTVGATETTGASGTDVVSDSPLDAAKGDAMTDSAATVDGVAVVGEWLVASVASSPVPSLETS